MTPGASKTRRSPELWVKPGCSSPVPPLGPGQDDAGHTFSATLFSRATLSRSSSSSRSFPKGWTSPTSVDVLQAEHLIHQATQAQQPKGQPPQPLQHFSWYVLHFFQPPAFTQCAFHCRWPGSRSDRATFVPILLHRLLYLQGSSQRRERRLRRLCRGAQI